MENQRDMVKRGMKSSSSCSSYSIIGKKMENERDKKKRDERNLGPTLTIRRKEGRREEGKSFNLPVVGKSRKATGYRSPALKSDHLLEE